MRRLRLYPAKLNVGFFVILILFISIFCLRIPLYSQAIIIDHKCTDISLVPESWIKAAKNSLRCSYGHTSHGSQLITGMTALMNDPVLGSLYKFNTNGAISAGGLSIADYTPDGDLGNPDRTEWEARTRNYLNGAGSNRNVVMWSWCGQVSSATAADINTYLTLMDGLEQDYPGVTFVYMTGHLDGTGAGGNLHARNNQIRAWCLANNKVLFDFADIESYDPDGSYFLNLGANDNCDYSGGNWAEQWIAANPGSQLAKLATACGSCAHSQTLNCILKARATWWLMARIAGWNGNSAAQPTIKVISPNGGEVWQVGSLHNITWNTTGTVGNVMIKYSTDNGGSWETVIASTVNNGTYKWTIPNTPSSKCLVKVCETDGSPADNSNAVFTIPGPGQTPTITLKSPNGGEVWPVGSLQTITWTTTGEVGNVMIKYTVDGGTKWSLVEFSTPNDGVYEWTIPNTPSTKCRVKISETDDKPLDLGDKFFSIIPSSEKPKICLNRDKFNFGYVMGGKVPKSQRLLIFNCGTGTLKWSSSADVGWLTLDPGSGTGRGKVEVVVDPAGLAPGYYKGTINITDPNAVNSPLVVTVNLKVKEKSQGKCPFGSFDSPKDSVVVSGSIPVTGWALDDVDMDSVKIYRKNNGKLIYIGDAVFVEGARPDVENSYPDYPWNYKAGWGYMLLTNCLPNHGNGKLVLHIFARDCSGNSTTLGSKTITVDNINAEKPFGALDSPTQGGIASGSSFINWGWALTPPPNHIPTNGSTIKVYVDGVYLGHPHFNLYRADIAGLFPNYANCNGAAGYFLLDTTSYENGVHTIQWTVTDNAGNTDGIGSRYFTIENFTSGSQSAVLETAGLPVDYWEPVKIKKGFDENIEPQMIYPDNTGVITIEIKELERLELHLSELFPGQSDQPNYYCYLVVGSQLRSLPVGSAFDSKKGVLYWHPGPGFLGRFQFVLLVENQDLEVIKKEILIKINPR
jgi:hypothetical protein